VNTLKTVKEQVSAFEIQHAAELKKIPGDFAGLFAATQSGIPALQQPEHPVGQKKAGNCKLPEGVCFLKSSLAILQKV
jgi:hypothetical protein